MHLQKVPNFVSLRSKSAQADLSRHSLLFVTFVPVKELACSMILKGC